VRCEGEKFIKRKVLRQKVAYRVLHAGNKKTGNKGQNTLVGSPLYADKPCRPSQDPQNVILQQHGCYGEVLFDMPKSSKNKQQEQPI
jgi:hypothetical protein